MYHRLKPLLFLAIGAMLLALSLAGASRTAHAQQSNRTFPQTGFTVTNDAIWNYFQARGGVDTFGYPASQTFLFQGFPVQVFQRNVIQAFGEQARPLNLLDPSLLPITRTGGLTLPGYDQPLAAAAPAPQTPNYSEAVQQFLAANVPDAWEGQPVDFLNYFYSAAPGGDPLVALEVWGFPTSRPRRDPNNSNYVYQRFQRGIMHYDATQNVTRGILLGDAFRNVLTGRNLSSGLRNEMANSALLNLYAPNQPNWMARTAPDAQPPITRENTDLTEAFEQDASLPMFTSAQVYLVEEDTRGAACSVNYVAVPVTFDSTAAPLTSALNEMVVLGEVNRSDLYNAAYVTKNIRLGDVTIQNGVATISFTGFYQSTRQCDLEWFRQQVEQTALQYDTIDDVAIFIGGTPIEQLIDAPVATVERVDVYLIALDSGGNVGCNDSAVAVERVLAEPTTMPLTAAISELLSINERMYGQSGLYNSLFQTDLHIEDISLNNGLATIRLVGEYQIGGVCDEPRVTAQLRQTALQFSTVNSFELYINGSRID